MGYNATTGAPLDQGFDYYYGQLDQANCHNMYPPFIWENTEQIFFPTNKDASRERCMKANNTCVWSHDLFTNKALEVIQQRAQHPDQPWFLEIAYTDPHAGGWEGTKVCCTYADAVVVAAALVVRVRALVGATSSAGLGSKVHGVLPCTLCRSKVHQCRATASTLTSRGLTLSVTTPA